MVAEHGYDHRDRFALLADGLGNDRTMMDGVEIGTVQMEAHVA